nr:hypothetical protein [uncultured bacterium]
MADRQDSSVPMRELVELASEARVGAPPEAGAGVTVDFEATRELGEPMIVVRVPERANRQSVALEVLTPREREIAGLVAQGLLNKQIALRLGVSIATVKDHVHNVLEKTGLPNRAAIAAAVAESRWD